MLLSERVVSFYIQTGFQCKCGVRNRRVRFWDAEEDAGSVGWARELVGFFFLFPAGWSQLAPYFIWMWMWQWFPDRRPLSQYSGSPLSQDCYSSPSLEHEGNSWGFLSFVLSWNKIWVFPDTIPWPIWWPCGTWESLCPSCLAVCLPANHSCRWKGIKQTLTREKKKRPRRWYNLLEFIYETVNINPGNSKSSWIWLNSCSSKKPKLQN